MNSFHEQAVTSSGVEVDAGLVEVMEALWALNFATAYSCEGKLEHSHRSYVTFSAVDDVVRTRVVTLFEQLVPSGALGFYNLVLAEDGGHLVTSEAYDSKHKVLIETYAGKPEYLTVRFEPELTAKLLKALQRVESA